MKNRLKVVLLVTYIFISIPTINLPLIIIKLFKLQNRNPLFKKIIEVSEKINKKVEKFLQLDKPTNTIKIDKRPNNLLKLPNRIIRNHISILSQDRNVIYYEPYYSKIINTYFKQKKEYLAKKGFSFINLNDLITYSSSDLNEYTKYHFPSYRAKYRSNEIRTESLQQLILNTDLIKDYFGLHEVQRPCFISLASINEHSKSEYDIYYLPESSKLLNDAIDYYFSKPKTHIYAGGIQASKGGRSFEKDIQEKEIEISKSLSNELSRFIKNHQTKGALTLMSRVINELKINEYLFDDNTKKIAEIIATLSIKEQSKILIKLNGDIELIDYAIKIKLTPLQKVVYHFFLNHPEGVLFKNLINYKNELITLYHKFSNKSDLKEMEQNINELVNPFTNSMSEKCSRIKEAFLKQIDETIANDYIIRGGRGDYKKISLDRSLIIYEKG